MIREQRPATTVAVTTQSKIMEGFSLYENAIHRLTMRYPSTWNKQEILLDDVHRGLEVMFLEPIRTRFSKTEDSETISDKIRCVIYNQFSAEVLLSLKRLGVHETYTLWDIINDHIHALGICFDDVNVIETLYDYNIGIMPASRLLYTYTDPLQNHVLKEGMKIISVKDGKEIVLTYSSKYQDFDKFLSTVLRMFDTFSLE